MRKVIPIYDPKHVHNLDDLISLRPTGSANFPAYLSQFVDMICRLQNRRQKTDVPEVWDGYGIGAMNFKVQPHTRWLFYIYATLDYPLYRPNGQIKVTDVELVNTESNPASAERYGQDQDIDGEFTIVEFLELMDKVHRGLYAI